MNRMPKHPHPPGKPGLAPGVPIVARSSTKRAAFGTPPARGAAAPAGAKGVLRGAMDLLAAEAAHVEQALSRYTGRAAIEHEQQGRSADFDGFVAAAVRSSDPPTQRERFLAALKRSLVRRY